MKTNLTVIYLYSVTNITFQKKKKSEIALSDIELINCYSVTCQ